MKKKNNSNSLQDFAKAVIQSKQFKNTMLSLFLIVFIGGYMVFFLSPVYMPTDFSTYKSTAFNTKESLDEKHQFTLLRWDYSEKQQLMELEMDIENTAFDGIFNYKYTAQSQPSGRMKTTVILQEESYLVLQIENVPKDFEQISFRIALPDGVNVLRFYSNKNSINKVDNIQALSKSEYLINRLKRNIALYRENITAYQKEIEKNKETISNINSQNQELAAGKKYMTEAEAKQADQRMSSNNTLIEQTQKQNEKLRLDVMEEENKISLAEERIADTK